MPHEQTRGFTLIEILIVLSVLGLLVTLTENALRSSVSQIGLQNTATTYTQTLRRAQALSIAGRGDSAWGVRIATTSITLFKGATFASRDTAYDEEYKPGVSYTVSGVSDISFLKLSGLPSTIGTTTINVPQGSGRSVYINDKGAITY